MIDEKTAVEAQEFLNKFKGAFKFAEAIVDVNKLDQVAKQLKNQIEVLSAEIKSIERKRDEAMAAHAQAVKLREMETKKAAEIKAEAENAKANLQSELTAQREEGEAANAKALAEAEEAHKKIVAKMVKEHSDITNSIKEAEAERDKILNEISALKERINL